jgi:hypothetical protein
VLSWYFCDLRSGLGLVIFFSCVYVFLLGFMYFWGEWGDFVM